MQIHLLVFLATFSMSRANITSLSPLVSSSWWVVQHIVSQKLFLALQSQVAPGKKWKKNTNALCCTERMNFFIYEHILSYFSKESFLKRQVKLFSMKCMEDIQVFDVADNSYADQKSKWCHMATEIVDIGSTLAQAMDCCLMAPNQYLNQCWLIISEILWH